MEMEKKYSYLLKIVNGKETNIDYEKLENIYEYDDMILKDSFK